MFKVKSLRVPKDVPLDSAAGKGRAGFEMVCGPCGGSVDSEVLCGRSGGCCVCTVSGAGAKLCGCDADVSLSDGDLLAEMDAIWGIYWTLERVGIGL